MPASHIPSLSACSSVENRTGFSSVSCGNAHAVALTTDGRVWAWGLNSHGQLGQGDDNKHKGPVHVALDGVTIMDAQVRPLHAYIERELDGSREVE